MSAAVISYRVCTCDGCSRRYENPSPEDETEYRAELTAVLGGWKRDGADVLCPNCAAVAPSMRPNWARQFRKGKAGVGV